MTLPLRLFAWPALALVLFACSPPQDEAVVPETENTATPADGVRASPGSADRAINLAVQELTGADVEQAELEGELGCSFAPSLGGETLFIGRADVLDGAGAQGAIKLPNGVHVVAMRALAVLTR